MNRNLHIVIFEGNYRNTVINLADFNKDIITFGRQNDNDIVLEATLVSRQHGYFEYSNGVWVIHDNSSTNGLFWNNRKVTSKHISSGDKILIGHENLKNRVAFVFSVNSAQNLYRKVSLEDKKVLTIGRGKECDICISHMAVHKIHCRVVKDKNDYYIEAVNTDAPIQFNGCNMVSRQKLCDMDRFLIGDAQFIYQTNELFYVRIESGMSFEVSHLSKTVGKIKRKVINDNVSFSVNSSEFIAIVGGSGAGKTTLLKCLCGCSKISEGSVSINGEDLVANYNSLKHLIGYVPQQDIVYDNLTLKNMLYYTARLRMPKDSTNEEIEKNINKALEIVELEDKKDVMIKSLSGGQKKRASIATELLSDPKLFFLDEPTSGLDPGTERNLMLTLKSMAQKGKTVVIVTHTPLNLHLCDKIVVMGKGGKLCYFGPPDSAKEYFSVNDITDIYDLINKDSEIWAAKYKKEIDQMLIHDEISVNKVRSKDKGSKDVSALKQTIFLTLRYAELTVNDLKRLVIQLLMSAGLGILLYAAFADAYPFKTSFDTQKLSLTLACCAFWIGLFNSIQEICKETQIFKRERMAGLKILPYISSKLILNGVLNIIQTLILLLSVKLLIGFPERGMLITGSPMTEMFVTTFLTVMSATCVGLLISALSDNADQAISIAPILLIPQILFSGIIVELQGIINTISYFISCRYTCVAYCTTANINNLPGEFKQTLLGIEKGEVVIIDSVYSFSNHLSQNVTGVIGEKFALSISNPIVTGWYMLTVICVVSVLFTALILKNKNK